MIIRHECSVHQEIQMYNQVSIVIGSHVVLISYVLSVPQEGRPHMGPTNFIYNANLY